MLKRPSGSLEEVNPTATLMMGKLMKLRSHLLALLALSFLSISASLAQPSDSLSITYDKPPKGLERIVGGAWFIYLNGRIDGESAEKLNAFIQSNDVPIRSMIILNSPGGSLYGGIELGRVIRKHNLNTDVGVRLPTIDENRRYAPGYCYSSCTYAYLGGVFRFLIKGSEFGVHRFYAKSPQNGNMDSAQITSAEIVSYVREMGVDPDFFALSTKAGADEVFAPSRTALEKLNVVNNGWTTPQWTVESKGGSMYLKGERNTQFGMNKFMIYCGTKGNVILHVIFDPAGHQTELKSFPSHSLVVDGRAEPLEVIVVDADKHSFNGIYALTSKQVASIMTAKTVGLMVRPAANSSLFLGFDSMPFTGAGEKLVGLTNSCVPF
jgi:hypothetical protein